MSVCLVTLVAVAGVSEAHDPAVDSVDGGGVASGTADMEGDGDRRAGDGSTTRAHEFGRRRTGPASLPSHPAGR